MTRDRISALLLSIGAVAAVTTTVLTAFAAPGKPARRAPARPAIARVDTELAARWKAAGVEPAPAASDAEFLRRVTLDLAGRIPTAGEALAFLRDRSSRRRERLVDRLLASSDHADYWADVYLDLLVGRDLRMRPRLSADAREYLRATLAANRPYDEVVRQILTASGPLDGNGAAGFLVAQERKGGSIEAVAGETARIFLGLQVQCARCHDHPYDQRYKKQSFADFTAFFGDVRLRRDKNAMGGRGLMIEDRPIPARAAQRPRFQERLKKRPDLAYAFAEPRYFFRAIDPRPGETKRQRLARAILTSDLFAKAAVNRIWTHLLGQPIAGASWDDLGAERDDKHPALLTILADDFTATGYDHRRLLKVIALSTAYARSSRAPAGTADAGATTASGATTAAAGVTTASANAAPPVATSNDAAGADAGAPAATAGPAPPAAATVKNSATVSAPAPAAATVKNSATVSAPAPAAVTTSVASTASAGTPDDTGPAFARMPVRPLSADQLYRSLLVAAGLPPGDRGDATIREERRRMLGLREFLFTFPDDEERQGDAFTGSVSQALLLLNGAVANLGSRARPDLALGRMLAASADPGQRIEWMFLATLSRMPTAAERDRYAAYIAEHSSRAAYEDLYHALLTSTEFTTNH